MEKVKGVITGSLKISLPSSIVFSIILFLLSDWIAISIFSKPILSIPLKIFAISIPFRVLLTLFSPSMKAFQKTKEAILSRKIIEPLLKFVFILLFLLIGLQVTAGALGYTIGFGIAALLAFYLMEKRVFPILKSEIKSVSLKRKLLKFSWPLMLTGILWMFVGRVDTLMIGWLIPEKAPLGIYQAAYPTAQFLNIIPTALSFLFLPIISDLLSREKEDEIRDIYKTSGKWIFYANLPILFILLMFPKAILNVLFGSEFLAGGIVLSILAVGFFVNSFGKLGGKMIDLSERTKLHLFNTISALTIDVILNYLLIPIYGILGAGIATATTFTVYGALQIIETWYFVGHTPFNLNFLKSLFAALIVGGFLYYTTNVIFPGRGLWLLILSSLVFLVLYSLIILLTKGLEKEDIMILKSLERKTGIRVKFLREIIKKFI